MWVYTTQLNFAWIYLSLLSEPILHFECGLALQSRVLVIGCKEAEGKNPGKKFLEGRLVG